MKAADSHELVERPPLHPNTIRRNVQSPDTGDVETGGLLPSDTANTRRASTLNKLAVLAILCILLASIITLPHFQSHRKIITSGADAIIKSVSPPSTSEATTPTTVAPATEDDSGSKTGAPKSTSKPSSSTPTQNTESPTPKKGAKRKPSAAPSSKATPRPIPTTMRAKGSWFRLPFSSGSAVSALPSGCHPYASVADVRTICIGGEGAADAPKSAVPTTGEDVAGSTTTTAETTAAADEADPPVKKKKSKKAKKVSEEAEGEETTTATTTEADDADPPVKKKKSKKASTESEATTAPATEGDETTTTADTSDIPKKKKSKKASKKTGKQATEEGGGAAGEADVKTTQAPAEAEAAQRKMSAAAKEDDESKKGSVVPVFPLKFVVEHDARVTPKKVICTNGCTKASIAQDEKAAVKRVGKSMTATITVVISSIDDVVADSPCAAFMGAGAGVGKPIKSLTDVCFFAFDFEVSMATATAPPAPVCHLSVGDWGQSPGVDSVALEMTKESAQGSDFIKFVVSTGDNFYPTGVKSLKDPHWEKTFETPFCHPSLAFVRWYICAGNHDQWGIKPQLQYGKLFNTKPVAAPSASEEGKCPAMRPPGWRSRWFFPTRTYVSDVPGYDVVGDQGMSSSMRIVTLDTYGKGLPQQVAFARNAFEANASDTATEVWRVMLNHAPVFSGSMHGQQPRTPPFQKAMLPMLQASKVHMYVNGDDHVLEIHRDPPTTKSSKTTGSKKTTEAEAEARGFEVAAAADEATREGWATDFFVNGAGGGSHLYTSIDLPQTVWRTEEEKVKGFMKHCVESVPAPDGMMYTELVTTAIKDDGSILYTHRTPYAQ